MCLGSRLVVFVCDGCGGGGVVVVCASPCCGRWLLAGGIGVVLDGSFMTVSPFADVGGGESRSSLSFTPVTRCPWGVRG